MITIIYGPPRVGKTALMTARAMEYMHGQAAHRDIRQSCKIIDELNDGGFRLTKPTRHLVFSDYTIRQRRDGSNNNYEVDGYYLGLPNKSVLTVFLPPYSRVFLDEAQKYYNSREKGLADFVSRFYEIHGHFRLNIDMTCQRPILVDKNIRELGMQFIEVLSLKHKCDGNKIIRSTWRLRVIDDMFELDKYLNGGKQDNIGHIERYTYDGNIFKHYDSYQHMTQHLKDRYNSDFDYIPAQTPGRTVESIRQYNELHSIVAPQGYRNTGKKGA